MAFASAGLEEPLVLFIPFDVHVVIISFEMWLSPQSRDPAGLPECNLFITHSPINVESRLKKKQSNAQSFVSMIHLTLKRIKITIWSVCLLTLGVGLIVSQAGDCFGAHDSLRMISLKSEVFRNTFV
ncbi:hypothetical protein AVEN_256590-1 [Araneus ventricosus]|uniref:Uncharacterized protein n=1 Tax=Araneus ventricosus TaxID=182803 RepID=A0A4Y2LKS3_ARAVE|nr:hypothetical protein AVEN_256590-1 [Araneus ventricosus]